MKSIERGEYWEVGDGSSPEVGVVNDDREPSFEEEMEAILRIISESSGKGREAMLGMYESSLRARLEDEGRNFDEIEVLVEALYSVPTPGLLGVMEKISGKKPAAFGFRPPAEPETKPTEIVLEVGIDEVVENLNPGPNGENLLEVLRIILGRIGCARDVERRALVEYYAPTLIACYLAQDRPIEAIAIRLMTLAYRNQVLVGGKPVIDGGGTLYGGTRMGFRADRE